MTASQSQTSGAADAVMQPQLSVVIPAYREATRILKGLETLTGYLSRQSYLWECIVADDGSPDETASIVDAFIREHPGLTIRLLREPHRGKGAAVRAGVLYGGG